MLVLCRLFNCFKLTQKVNSVKVSNRTVTNSHPAKSLKKNVMFIDAHVPWIMDETNRNFDESSSTFSSVKTSQGESDDTVKNEVSEVCLKPCNNFFGAATDLLRPNQDLENLQQSKCLNTAENIDMEKIVNDVKTRLRELKKKKTMQQNGYGGKQIENGSFCLNLLFDESNFSCKQKTFKKKGRRSRKCISSGDQSETELLGLQLLFEETKANTKRKKMKAAKAKKIKAARTAESETFGLEWLFNESKGRKSRKKRKVQNDYEEDEDGEEIPVPVVKKKKPNYFVAIRVSNPQIHVMANDFQASVLKENDKLKPALIPLPSLHITMAVLFLDGNTEIAKNSLAKCTSSIIDILKSIDFKLKFQGVGNFQHEVVFAKIEEGKQLESLQAINTVITSALENEGIIVDNKKEWKAHLTLLKLSRKPKLRRKGIKKISEEVYAAWNDSYFGEELVTSISLCSMFEPKEKDGFYKCIETISLEPNEKTSECETQDLLIDPM